MTFEKFKPFLIGTGILTGAVVVVLGLGAAKPESEKEETPKPPLVVRTAPAEMKEQTVFATFQGEVRAKTDIQLVAQVTGKVKSVSDKFIEGGKFSAGETLLQIDDADYLVALKSAEASVASAKVDLEVERATAANRAKEWEDLQGRPIEQANPLLLNKPQIDRAKARLNAAQAELAAAKLNYERTKVSAPFDGRVMTKEAELGQFISRGASVGRVFATEAMEVRIPMTDLQVSELGLSLGYNANSTEDKSIPARVSTLFGDEVQYWDGYVRSVDASIDSQTRLLFATVVVDQPFNTLNGGSLPLVPGLFVDVELASPQKLVGLELPRAALRNGNQVYVFDNDELITKPVKVIYTSNDKVIVAQTDSAIDVNQKVITSSVPGAYTGMPVKLFAGSDDMIADQGLSEGAGTDGVSSPSIPESEQKDETAESTDPADAEQKLAQPEDSDDSEASVSDKSSNVDSTQENV